MYIQFNFQSFRQTDLEETGAHFSQEDCASKWDQDLFCVSFDFYQQGDKGLLSKQKCRLLSSSPQPSNVKIHHPHCSIFVHKQRQPQSSPGNLKKPEVAVLMTSIKSQSIKINQQVSFFCTDQLPIFLKHNVLNIWTNVK